MEVREDLYREAESMRTKRPASFGDGYAVCAAPESIETYLVAARKKVARAQREVDWLQELSELRMSQKERGLWP